MKIKNPQFQKVPRYAPRENNEASSSKNEGEPEGLIPFDSVKVVDARCTRLKKGGIIKVKSMEDSGRHPRVSDDQG